MCLECLYDTVQPRYNGPPYNGIRAVNLDLSSFFLTYRPVILSTPVTDSIWPEYRSFEGTKTQYFRVYPASAEEIGCGRDRDPVTLGESWLDVGARGTLIHR